MKKKKKKNTKEKKKKRKKKKNKKKEKKKKKKKKKNQKCGRQGRGRRKIPVDALAQLGGGRGGKDKGGRKCFGTMVLGWF